MGVGRLLDVGIVERGPSGIGPVVILRRPSTGGAIRRSELLFIVFVLPADHGSVLIRSSVGRSERIELVTLGRGRKSFLVVSGTTLL